MKCEDCDATVNDHKWAKIKAHNEGWYFTKDKHAYCPNHTPQWVATWRRKSETFKSPDSSS